MAMLQNRLSLFGMLHSPIMLCAEHPFSLVIFGASGHLASMKLFPALYFLALKKRFPSQYTIIGFARTEMSDDAFRQEFADAVRTHVPEVNEGILAELLTHVSYHTGQYDQKEDFLFLTERLKQGEKGAAKVVRLAYLSIPPSAFATVLNNLCEGGVHDHARGAADFRCIVEKPVGHDAASYERIRSALFGCMREDEVYILDHYLGKEAVRNVYYLRFANPVIERLMKNTLISNVQITAAESAGLEGRVGYFEAVGTLRDMFQSHLLQIAALLTMRLLGEERLLKATRLEAIKNLYIPPHSDLGEIVMQGQYEDGVVEGKQRPSYRQEEGIASSSRTPTYAVMKVASRNSRWAGVPIFLRSGKRLMRKETRIAIEFQESLCFTSELPRNRLDIILQGEAGMKLYLRTKLGGSEPQFRPLIMEDPLVCVGDCLPEHSLLLLEAINGNQQWFVDPEEVRMCWALIDPLQCYLEQPGTPLSMYPSGSRGPKELEDFLARSGFSWLE